MYTLGILVKIEEQNMNKKGLKFDQKIRIVRLEVGNHGSYTKGVYNFTALACYYFALKFWQKMDALIKM